MHRGHPVNLLEIDQDKCCGYGICVEICPEVFSLDRDGFVAAETTEIPDELLASAEEAAGNCPENVLRISRRPD
ncbi:ferredoxin [Nocardia jinanensis]|uniref:Ferredoxin n=2 Tax=Nocardia jinanensis TaxID=382504 RepID=A0A917VUG4_9NOCA|nr:ferredoxin [Nocardia jinanensis]